MKIHWHTISSESEFLTSSWLRCHEVAVGSWRWPRRHCILAELRWRRRDEYSTDLRSDNFLTRSWRIEVEWASSKHLLLHSSPPYLPNQTFLLLSSILGRLIYFSAQFTKLFLTKKSFFGALYASLKRSNCFCENFLKNVTAKLVE